MNSVSAVSVDYFNKLNGVALTKIRRKGIGDSEHIGLL